jgi:hypothetical protein
MRLYTLAATALLLGAAAGSAQDMALTCEGNRWRNNDQESFCEMREQTVAFAGRLSVDAGQNGGIAIKGWDQANVLVRAQIHTFGKTEADAKALASQIRLDVSAGVVKAVAPVERNYGVSFEIFVPRRADLTLTAHNGGIAIDGVNGRIQFETKNGGVNLTRLGGDVQGRTTNGGVKVALEGQRWEGTKLDVTTTNGGVKIAMPENYSAQLETETVNGGLRVDFPVVVRGEMKKKLSTTIGSGGPLIRVVTTNGGVTVGRS